MSARDRSASSRKATPNRSCGVSGAASVAGGAVERQSRSTHVYVPLPPHPAQFHTCNRVGGRHEEICGSAIRDHDVNWQRVVVSGGGDGFTKQRHFAFRRAAGDCGSRKCPGAPHFATCTTHCHPMDS